jgi:hypothetical protein
MELDLLGVRLGPPSAIIDAESMTVTGQTRCCPILERLPALQEVAAGEPILDARTSPDRC